MLYCSIKGENLTLNDFKNNSEVKDIFEKLKTGHDSPYVGVFIYYINKTSLELGIEKYLMQAQGTFKPNGDYIRVFDVDKGMQRIEALYDKIMKIQNVNIIGFMITDGDGILTHKLYIL